MTLTWRLYVLLLVPAALGALGGAGAALAPLLVVLVVLSALADWLLGRDLRAVQVHREIEPKLSLGAWNPVCLVVTNPAGRSLSLEVRDVVPVLFQVRGPDEDTPTQASTRSRLVTPAPGVVLARARVPSQGQVPLGYRVLPTRRGDYQFGELYVRAAGPLGLVRRQWRLPDSEETVRVYPNLRDLRRYDLMARRGLLIEAGARLVRAPGAATEFERLRDYVPDDEFRRINWKATARRGKPIVNQLEAERSQNLVIMLDAGRLMAARAELSPLDGGVDLTKLDFALNSALLLAYVGSVRGDRVALLAYSDEVRAFLPPARGRRSFLSVVQALYRLEPQPVEPDHGVALQFLASRNLRRSLVVLFTDVSERESSAILAAHVAHAARHHQVVLVTLADPAIRQPALARPHDGQSLYEKLVALRLLEERASVLAELGCRGAVTLDVPADQLSPRVVATYLELKRRGRV